MIGIIDYGMGNLGSVANALAYLGIEAEVVNNPKSLNIYDHLILPGVGSFTKAMQHLNQYGWNDALRHQVASGIPFMGICLGMQLIFDSGEEHGNTVGLGFLSGKVIPLNPSQLFRVPHIGWNGLTYKNRHPLFDGVKEHVDFYFVHSFQCVPAEESTVIAECEYGGSFTAAVGQGNIVGVQFHPEKSQDMGLRILENFAEWDGTC